MLRLLLVAFIFAACSENPLDPHSLRRFPTANVDERLHLSRDDENQIYRLVYRQSSYRISRVSLDGQKGTVTVSCGGDDVFDGDIPRLTGDYFELEKVGPRWRIIGKGWWMR
ncbi:MAG: hypothetical protein QOH39_3015 [Verrucomicrobiota bacterium]|jgi:YD repeat-containing protein